jgi:hypothetical protein
MEVLLSRGMWGELELQSAVVAAEGPLVLRQPLARGERKLHRPHQVHLTTKEEAVSTYAFVVTISL